MTKGLVIAALCGVALSGCTDETKLQAAEARGVQRGQCSMMWWYMKTDGLKPDAAEVAKLSYPGMCEEEAR